MSRRGQCFPIAPTLPTQKEPGEPLERCSGGHLDLAGRLALRPAELALALGCSERLIRGQLHRIPHVRIGGALFFPVDGIRAWLVSQARAERRRADEVIDSLRSRIAGDLNES